MVRRGAFGAGAIAGVPVPAGGVDVWAALAAPQPAPSARNRLLMSANRCHARGRSRRPGFGFRSVVIRPSPLVRRMTKRVQTTELAAGPAPTGPDQPVPACGALGRATARTVAVRAPGTARTPSPWCVARPI